MHRCTLERLHGGLFLPIKRRTSRLEQEKKKFFTKKKNKWISPPSSSDKTAACSCFLSAFCATHCCCFTCEISDTLTSQRLTKEARGAQSGVQGVALRRSTMSHQLGALCHWQGCSCSLLVEVKRVTKIQKNATISR